MSSIRQFHYSSFIGFPAYNIGRLLLFLMYFYPITNGNKSGYADLQDCLCMWRAIAEVRKRTCSSLINFMILISTYLLALDMQHVSLILLKRNGLTRYLECHSNIILLHVSQNMSNIYITIPVDVFLLFGKYQSRDARQHIISNGSEQILHKCLYEN